MVQGTSSSVGKSVLVAALCRIFRREGLRVAPFKAQNMALNSAVTVDGGEIGRAQAVQAEAAGIAPTVDLNPILLKPEADARSQVIVHGRPAGRLDARDFLTRKADLWPFVVESLDRLRAAYDLVVVEGAGSPAEINLRAGDLANMRVARFAGSPVLLVGDIDRGGVFASFVGTLALLEPEERRLVKGFVVNKFRGDLDLLRPGLRFLEGRTGVPVAGVVPYLRDVGLAEEDSVALERRSGDTTAAAVDVAVIHLPHISNFDDFDPLAAEPGVAVRYVRSADELGRPDLVILPGTKTTVADLAFLRQTGLAAALVDRARAGAAVLGICGGYQMLGATIGDPDRVESTEPEVPGLGLLPAATVFAREKTTVPVRGELAGWLDLPPGSPIDGYEIHMGRTAASGPPLLRIVERAGRPDAGFDGCTQGTVAGTYVHGLFTGDGFRRALLARLAARKGVRLPPAAGQADPYDRLADAVQPHLDLDLIRDLAGLGRGRGHG